MNEQENIFRKRTHFEQAFHVHDGPALDNLYALMDFLPEMTDAQWAHHVHDEKNDFAWWIEGVHGPGTLSRAMRAAATKEDLLALLRKKASEYRERERAEKTLPKEGVVGERTAEKIVEEAPRTPTQVEPPSTSEESMAEEGEEANAVSSEEFDREKGGYATKNEELQDRFDAIASRLKESLQDPMPKEVEKKLEGFAERYAELRTRMSDLRKKGHDALIPALILKTVPPKLQMAKVTRDPKDMEKIAIILKHASNELDEIEKEKILDVRAEVMHMAGLDASAEEKG